MAIVERETLETILKRTHYENSPHGVVDVKSSKAVGKWENYFGQIERISAQVILGSGRQKRLSIIVKNRPATTRLKEITVRNGFFVREITMYEELLPQMENLLHEFGDTSGMQWAKCYGTRKYDQLILEDLCDKFGVSHCRARKKNYIVAFNNKLSTNDQATGYQVANRLELMDFHLSRFALCRLAKFHAASYVLLDRHDIPREIIGRSIWHKGNAIARMTARYTKSLVKQMKLWGDEWSDAIERLEAAVPDFAEKYIGALDYGPNDFTVLNHGDFWTNNMLFKCDPHSGHPTDVKFIDWQASHFGNPADDLHKFFITSVKPEVLATREEELLAAYCSALQCHLAKLGCEVDDPVSLSDMRQLLARTFALRLGGALLFTANVVGVHEELDFEEAMVKEAQADTAGAASSWDAHSRLTPAAKSLIQLAIKDAIMLGVI